MTIWSKTNHDAKGRGTLMISRPLIVLGIGALCSLCGLWLLLTFDAVRLRAFGPTATLYFTALKKGFILSTTILILSFILFALCGKYIERTWSYGIRCWTSMGNLRQNLGILTLCILFAFISHANNIIHGYFYLDDFEVIEVNRSYALLPSLFIPHGDDHTIPLFRAEMRTLDTLFGQNPAPYNILVFMIFSLVPFFTYLAWKRLGLDLKGFALFLIMYSGTPAWAEMLTGYYTISIYLQISLFFAIMTWAYIAWMQSKQWRYLAVLTLSLMGAATIDNSGIWVFPALMVVMLGAYGQLSSTKNLNVQKRIKMFFAENKYPLFILTTVLLLFGAFLATSFFILQSGTFLVSSHGSTREIPKNIISIISSGLTLSIIAPTTIKLLAHPVLISKAARIWPAVEYLLLLINMLFVWYAITHADKKERAFMIACIASLCITVLMVAVARQITSAIPDFNFKHIGVAFYFYCIAIALALNSIIRVRGWNASRTVVPIVIITIAIQQAFGFHAIRLRSEAALRRQAVERVKYDLIPEIQTLAKNKTVNIPDLAGSHIHEPLAGISLADYLFFFNVTAPIALFQNNSTPPHPKLHTVETAPSLRAAVSPSFIEAFRKPSFIRSWYANPALMRYFVESETMDGNARKTNISNTNNNSDKRAIFDPEKLHVMHFELLTDDVPGNTELALTFKNDFNIASSMGRIRIDDYTSYTMANGKRRYAVTTDLLQLYTYALSRNVADVALHVSGAKNGLVQNMYLE